MVEALKAAGEPKPEVLTEERENYNLDRQEDPTMPAWEDFFTYGYDLKKIFKFQPIKVDAATAELKDELETYTIKPPKVEAKPVLASEEDDDDEPAAPAPKAKPKKAVVAEESGEDSDEELDDSWM
jgi:hypothetical protein